MHNHILHQHPARRHEKRGDATLENSDSLANVVERAAANNDVATLYSVVYVTASATFSGPTAGYVTVGLPSSSSAAARSTAEDTDKDATTSGTTIVKTTLVKSASAASSSATASSHSTASTSSKTKSAASAASTPTDTLTTSATSSSVSSSSPVSSSSSTTISGAALAEATNSSSASASPSATSAPASSGLSSGAKGGVAFAVILAVALLAGLGFFFYRRKKSQRGGMGEAQRLADDEKRAPPPANDTPAPPVPAVTRSASPRVQSPAPRLSVRLTDRFSLGADPEKAAAAAIGAVGKTIPKKSAWERRSQYATTATDPSNPFGIHAETVDAPTERVVSPTPMLNPSESTVSFELEGSSVPAAFESAPKSDAPETAPSARSSPPFHYPMSPSKAEFGTASAVPLVAGTGAAAASTGMAPLGNNVHRVQLEFKPSMDDELELKVGSLVRLLHEYDDGWALCMTMDRTKQGVAPRTCVSKLPLKPRAVGPSNGRPMGSHAQGMRKVSEPPRANHLVPAPLSPSVNGRMSPGGPPRQRTVSGPVSQSPTRSMSPGPRPSKPMADARPRSASMGSVNPSKPSSPAGPSPLNPISVPARKPVPGQAL